MPRYKISFVAGAAFDTSDIEAEMGGLDYDLDTHVCGASGEVIEAVKGADIIITWALAMPREVIEAIDRAQAIVSFGHGFDKIDHEAAAERGIMVANTAGIVSEEVANHAIMLLLACARKLTVLDRQTRRGEWLGGAITDLLPMPRLYGEVLGLVGLGSIGRATAMRALPFGLEVIAYDRYVEPWLAREVRVELVDSLEELASRSDFVSMHTPLNDDTRHIAGESFFRAMKPTAYLINTSRGGTVDEKALVEALRNGEIAGAGLDVFEEEPAGAGNPLFAMDNVILTPHTAGLSSESFGNGSAQIGQETARILRGTLPMSLVNPDVLARIPQRPPATNA